MSKKNKPDKNGFVFSTDPSFRFDEEEQSAQVTLPPRQQKLRLRLDTKQRGGKAVTVVENFTGSGEDLEALGKSLKNYCGTGGAVKEGLILIQGDQRDKILQKLLKDGYSGTKKAG
jgi:translation initiation factor 1